MNTSSISEWLDSLGSKTPAPGGGAVAGINSALAASALKMVCEYSTGPKYADIETEMNGHIQKLQSLSEQSQQQAELDAKGYSALREAYKLPKEDKKARDNAIQDSLKQSVQPAVEIIDICEQVLDIAENILSKSNPYLISDIAVSAANAKSAIESSLVNLEINQPQVKQTELSNQISGSLSKAEKLIVSADSIFNSARQKIREAQAND